MLFRPAARFPVVRYLAKILLERYYRPSHCSQEMVSFQGGFADFRSISAISAPLSLYRMQWTDLQ